ncbi:hypothetical protein EXIGLDRAFT_725885 [Exidia glandulosa HHB12029]|uniref:Uncharacterized protein n=1 Tax=Exidia glandulosa HHB12029 TaxID=1314781 RepID=A0A166B9W5_EXIGL|nr:hypothetical protein EXIGLDRAFT_725885 [Exidia glandulosa HHB12029]
MRSFARPAALFLIASTIAFSRPIRRLAAVVTNDGIFEKALQLADIGDPAAYGVKFANTLSSDPRICDPVQQLVTALIDGENAGGVNSVGDRAIVGARKLLGLESQGDAGLVTVLSGLLDGSYPPNVKTALQQAIQNPAKTIASLQTYKLLVDVQVALGDLATTTANIGGNSTIVNEVDSNLTPALQSVEAIIDKIGADFSVGNVASQGEDITQILDTLTKSSDSIAALPASNGALASSVTDATNKAIDTMQALVESAKNAAQLAQTPPVIPDEVFTDFPGPGTACQ